MSTDFARKMVQEESILGFTECFVRGMKQRTDYILENLQKGISQKILFDRLNEDYETKLDNTIDHIISEINETGIENLSETINRISALYNINPADVVFMFESAIDSNQPIEENINYNKLQQHLLKQLNTILDENAGNIISFTDTTSTYVTPQEGNALVEVYSQLGTENKQKMVERMVESKTSFNQVLSFAKQTLNESISGGGQ